MPTIHAIIKGKVQGVFYRATAKKKADEIGVKGWIANTDAGDVEVVCSGTKEQLKEFIEWCRQGPPLSKVEDVETTDTNEQQFAAFVIHRK
jgi:acylphosphatase